MRKLLLALLLMFITSLGYCGPVNTSGYPAIITADDVSINWLNNFRSSVVNTLNSFPGDNIQSTTITATILVDNANPEIRWGEAFSEFVYTGLIPPSIAGLTTTTTAGTAYVKNDTTNKMTRVVKDATAHLYTASKDTYVDLSTTGVYTYTAVANGAAAPVVAANSIRLAKVVTDATDVTSVSDLRVMGVQLSTDEDFYIKGMELYYSTNLAVSCDAGIVYNGATRVEKITATVLTLATAADWWDGATDTYGGGAGWCYIGVNSSGNVKLLGANPPDKHDTDGDTVGTLYYWYDGAAYWRVIGAVRVNTSNQIINEWEPRGNLIKYVTPVSVTTTLSVTVWSTPLSCSASIPGISQLGLFGLEVLEAGQPVAIYIRSANSPRSAPVTGEGFTGTGDATGQVMCPTDSSQRVIYYTGNETSCAVVVQGYYLNLRD